jgi:hypothetical protein
MDKPYHYRDDIAIPTGRTAQAAPRGSALEVLRVLKARRLLLRRPDRAYLVEEKRREHPGASVELWATDAHRIGLKPIVRGVWAPLGERPIALGHHRFE